MSRRPAEIIEDYARRIIGETEQIVARDRATDHPFELKRDDRCAVCELLDAMVWFGNYDAALLRRVERAQDHLDCLDEDGETAEWRE